MDAPGTPGLNRRLADATVRFPTFRVMQEDGWAGLLDLNGNIMQESLFALRENLLWISRKARPTYWSP